MLRVFYFSLFSSHKNNAYFTSVLVARFFSASFILESKLNSVNQLNSGPLIKLVVSRILFLISIAFVLTAALIAKLQSWAKYL